MQSERYLRPINPTLVRSAIERKIEEALKQTTFQCGDRTCRNNSVNGIPKSYGECMLKRVMVGYDNPLAEAKKKHHWCSMYEQQREEI